MVRRRENEELDSMIRRLKKQVESDGTLVELRKREYYRSPSQKRKEKEKLARKRNNKYSKKY